jgi:bifunctional DNA-binding transcriptional regulator/antitoxin component of YhaV-PrlF toxin-antitoxin module
MTTVVKKKTPIVIPESLRRQAGIVPGDRVEMQAVRGVITIVANPPTPDDDYTPEQRRIINARIAEARKGPYYGPFETGAEAVKFLRKEIKARKAAKTP